MRSAYQTLNNSISIIISSSHKGMEEKATATATTTATTTTNNDDKISRANGEYVSTNTWLKWGRGWMTYTMDRGRQ